MKRKITLLLLSALLVSGMANAHHGFKSEPIWAYSWGVGMGTMVPQGNLATHFNPGFALDTEVGGYYHDLFLMVNGGFSTSKIAKDIPVGESRWPAGTGSIHAFIGTNLGMNFDVDPFIIYPFAGVAYNFIEPNLETANSNPALGTLKVNGMGLNLGIGLDYDTTGESIGRIRKIGFRYQCQFPSYKEEGSMFDGTTHWITLRFMIGSYIIP
jgi:hypothetical protein